MGACWAKPSPLAGPPTTKADGSNDAQKRDMPTGGEAEHIAAVDDEQAFVDADEDGVLMQEPHEPEMVHRLVAASVSQLDWKGLTEVPDWLNQLIKRIWPSLSEAIEQKVKEEAVHAIRDNLPDWIEGEVKLDHFALGSSTPPRLEGIRCTDTENGIKVAIGIDFWSGVDIAISVGLLRLGVSELKFAGCAVLEMAPLIGELPVVGALDIYFPDPPHLHFKFTGLAKMAELPVLRSAIRSAIDAAIAGQLVLPNSVVVPLAKEDPRDQRRIRVKRPIGVLRVTAQRATGLKKADWSLIPGSAAESDPYVCVKVGGKRWSSTVVQGTSSPEWTSLNDSHDIVVYDLAQQVCLEVLDDDALTADDSLGVTRPAAVPDAVALSGKEMQLFERVKYTKGSTSLMEGATRGALTMRFDWLLAVPDEPGRPGSRDTAGGDGYMLVAEIDKLRLPARLARAVQVRLKFGTHVDVSRYVTTGSAKLEAAVKSVDASVLDIICKGGKCGVALTTLAEMTGLQPDVVAMILADDGQRSDDPRVRALSDLRVTAGVRFGSCLAVPVKASEADLAALAAEGAQLEVVGLSKQVLARAAVRLGEGRTATRQVVELQAAEGEVAMRLDLRLSLATLQKGAPQA